MEVEFSARAFDFTKNKSPPPRDALSTGWRACFRDTPGNALSGASQPDALEHARRMPIRRAVQEARPASLASPPTNSENHHALGLRDDRVDPLKWRSPSKTISTPDAYPSVKTRIFKATDMIEIFSSNCKLRQRKRGAQKKRRTAHDARFGRGRGGRGEAASALAERQPELYS